MAKQIIIRSLEDIPEEWLSDEQRRSRVNKIYGKGDLLNEMYTLACKAGVKDKSYNTVRHGGVSSYAGATVIEYRGLHFLARGSKPTGTPEFLSSRGGITFTQE